MATISKMNGAVLWLSVGCGIIIMDLIMLLEQTNYGRNGGTKLIIEQKPMRGDLASKSPVVQSGQVKCMCYRYAKLSTPAY